MVLHHLLHTGTGRSVYLSDVRLVHDLLLVSPCCVQAHFSCTYTLLVHGPSSRQPGHGGVSALLQWASSSLNLPLSQQHLRWQQHQQWRKPEAAPHSTAKLWDIIPSVVPQLTQAVILLAPRTCSTLQWWCWDAAWQHTYLTGSLSFLLGWDAQTACQWQVKGPSQQQLQQ